MMDATRSALEEIAVNINWPDEISEYIINLHNYLTEDQKLDAITEALFQDTVELKDRYFGNYSGKSMGQLIEYAHQRDWPIQQKVQIGAIEGIEHIWFRLNQALLAMSWGSKRLNVAPGQAINYALNITKLAYDKTYLSTLHLRELWQIKLAIELVTEGEGMAIGRITNSPYFRIAQRIATMQRRGELQRTRGYEERQVSLRRDRDAVGRLREYLAQLRVDAVLWEQDVTGKTFVAEASKDVRYEPAGQKSERRLPFTIGKVYGASKARDLYIARYDLLH